MNTLYEIRLVILFAFMAAGFTGASATAQTDRIYPISGSITQGVINSVTKNGIKIQVGGSSQDIPTNTIKRVVLVGDPGSISKGVIQILDGQYESGLTELEKTDYSKLDRDEVKAEYAFYKAFAMGKQALSGRGDPAAAAKLMLDFAGAFRDSWHFYEAAQMLGDLAMHLGSHDKAAQYYGFLAGAPFAEYQLQAKYLEGMALLRSGKPDDALKSFQLVSSAKVTSPEEIRFQKMSRAGVVAAMAVAGQVDKSLEMLKPMLKENDPVDIEASARLYNAQGTALLQKRDFEGALLAYLHTDLLFSAVADAHVDALAHLIELWNKLGQPDRAAASRSKLQRLYPGVKPPPVQLPS